jgi:hypothetical protein
MSNQGWLAERRLSGLLLVAGSLLFFVAAGLPLWDNTGKSVYLTPLLDQFAFILGNGALWAWTNALFIAGTLVVLAGMVLLEGLLTDGGDRVLARLGLMAVSLGALLWIIEMAFRISVAGWAHGDANSPAAVDLYVRLSGWVETLFIIFTVLNLFGIAAFGASLLMTRLVPAWAGWFAIAVGLFGLVILILTGDLQPFLSYVPVLAMGIAILLKRRAQPVLEAAC